jgi:hypothetical protein
LSDRLTGGGGRGLPPTALALAVCGLALALASESGSGAADSAFELGFLGRERPGLSGTYDLQPLNGVLAEEKLPPVP